MAIQLLQLTFLILQLNKAIDSGKYDDISIADVHSQIEQGEIIQWLKRRIEHFDASPWIHDQASLAWYDDTMLRYATVSTWGIKNKGLCLLVAMTNEIIQQCDGVDFRRS